MNTSFQRSENNKDEWLTPPSLLKGLGDFDLDPCSPIKRPYETAKKYFTVLDNGLIQDWFGRVWCNPPYGNQTDLWLKKCKEHGNCVALVFARTETKMFFNHVWENAHSIYFIKGRIKFLHITRTRSGSAGASSVLIAYGENNKFSLESVRDYGYDGKLIILK